jgi:hypothetical protein
MASLILSIANKSVRQIEETASLDPLGPTLVSILEMETVAKADKRLKKLVTYSLQY